MKASTTTLTFSGTPKRCASASIFAPLFMLLIAGSFVSDATATVVIYRVSESAAEIVNSQPAFANQEINRSRFKWTGYAVIHLESFQTHLVYTEKTKDFRRFSIWNDHFVDSGALVGKNKLLRKHAEVLSSAFSFGGDFTEHSIETISGIHRPDRDLFPATLKRVYNVEAAGSRVTRSIAMKGTWRLDRKLSRYANSEDDEAEETEGSLARGLEEIKLLLESKNYTNDPLAVLSPKGRLLVNSGGMGTAIYGTFYE